jgi:CRP-like cAMP-binding protein
MGQKQSLDSSVVARHLCGADSFRGVDVHALRATIDEHKRHHVGVQHFRNGDLVARSGGRMTHLLLVEDGAVAAWQIPVSRLEAPYLLGEHEFVAGLANWIATYSAASERCNVLCVPVELMAAIVRDHPQVQHNIARSLFLRISRYYWTSLATNGTPPSQVAAAIMSRLALRERDYAGVGEVEISLQQKEIGRLTNLSRPWVAQGLKALEEAGVIEWVGGEKHKTGRLRVRDVDQLREQAFEYFQQRILPDTEGGSDRMPERRGRPRK